MVINWPQLRLDEVTEIIVDCPHSTPKWTDEGVVVLRNQYIRDGRLDLTAPSYTTKDGYDKRIKRAVPSAGDLVLTREAPMGEVCQIPDSLKCCLGQRMVLIRANKKIVDPKYLLFVLQSPYLQHQISWNEGTGTTVSNIRIPNIKAFNIPTPPFDEQKAIAHILGTLDDKIELNRQMNATLEAMAQALFKSWFVDFDPVIDNALAAGHPIPEPLHARAEVRKALGDKCKPLPEAIQKQFPNRFVFNEEMGWVPEGWEEGVLEDMVVLQRGFDLPKRKRIDGDYSLMLASGQDGTHNEFRVKGPGITTGRSGKLGEVNFVFRDFWPLNTTLWVKEYKNSSPYHGLYLLRSLGLEKYNSGSAVPTLNRNHIHNIPLLVPPTAVVESYGDIVAGFYEKMHFNSEQENNVARLRDALLPKLLSGQLRIPDAVKLIQESV